MSASTSAPTTTSSSLTTAETPSVDLIEVVIAAVIVAILGSITNSLSISFFITKIKSNSQTRNTEENTKLFLGLNVFDLLVCVSSALRLMSLFIYNETVFQIFFAIRRVSICGTGFFTCLLAVVRAIHLVRPLWAIKWTVIKISAVIFVFLVILIQLVYFKSITGDSGYTDFIVSDKDDTLSQYIYTDPNMETFFTIIFNIEFIIQATLFLLVVAANTTIAIKLLTSQAPRVKWKRRATVTVAIISAIYCVCNLGYLVLFLLPLYSRTLYDTIPGILSEIFSHVLLPLNSASNPAVYLIRKADMRAHLRNLFERFCLCQEPTTEGVGLFQSRAGSFMSRAGSFAMIEFGRKTREFSDVGVSTLGTLGTITESTTGLQS